ncbi:tetratricopeptide repeat-containing sensor histidine kinase [Paraflavitalea pollutisoli]|uniref:tetratricopeptide repeat-containing sensor histidine kinase n=1 Tax=Paraflavitalea pollutisoli TaxID=3034143 RepID=UPI0023EC1918|nr:ATP-binding protein [Paraflavitalea sp. H1-2-19X]
MTRIAAVLIILLASSKGLVAQTHTIDSLLQAVYRAGNDRDQLTAMLHLCEEYASINRDTLDHYSFRARALAAQTGDKRSVAQAEIAVANDYFRWGWIDSALVTIAPVVKNHQVTNAEERPLYFKAARQQALYYGSHSKNQEALTILYRIVHEAEQYNDTAVMVANMNTIGSIDLSRETPATALPWFRTALAKLGNTAYFDPIRASIYINLAQAHRMLNRSDSAVYYGEQGIRLMRASHNLNNLALSLQRQSDIYLQAGQIDKAETALQEMIDVRQQLHDDAWVDDNISLVNFYITTKQLDKAIAFCQEKLQRGDVRNAPNGPSRTYTNKLGMRIGFYELLARCYKEKGDSHAYEGMLEQIILAKDSLANAESELAIAEMQTKYAVQKKENTIIQQQLTIAQKNNILLLGVSAGAIVIVTGFMLFRDFRKKQRLRMQQAIEQEKLTTAKAIADAEENERKRIAADLHDSLGAYAASIASNVDILQTNGISEDNRTAMHELNSNSQTMVAQLSDTIWALNKDTLSLTAISDRLKVFLHRIRKSHQHIEMEVIEKIGQDISLPPTQAFHLFQVIQEAVTNAVKHSGANLIQVHIEVNSSWQIKVQDNGRGFSPLQTTKGGGHGLKNMQARAAAAGWTLGWTNGVATGTTVRIEPIHHKN